MPRVGVVGATGAVGSVLRGLLEDRDDVRYFASARSAGQTLDGKTVEEATPDTLASGELDLCFFAVGASASRELVPHAVRGGAVAIDKSSAWRMEPGVPLVVPEVNGGRALEHKGVIAVPNCSTIQLVVALKPLIDAAGLSRLRLATYQSVSGAGAQAMERLRAEPVEEHDLRGDWDFDGEEFEEEAKIREETRKILELPELPVQATCVRVPVLVGHLEAVWIETGDDLSPERARELLVAAPGVRLVDVPSPAQAAGGDDVLVGRVRRDPTVEHGLTLLVAGDNLRKGAALNAVQIADLLFARERAAA
ncbi:MAG: aspartate-semialdehyde dehydrogenase [Gaiellaceae bacterium]